jgi:hypothetical protein
LDSSNGTVWKFNRFVESSDTSVVFLRQVMLRCVAKKQYFKTPFAEKWRFSTLARNMRLFSDNQS